MKKKEFTPEQIITRGDQMRAPSRTKQELLEEISSLKQRIKDLQQPEVIRKRTEEALRESEERYRTFIDSTSDMVFLKDENFRYILVNKKLATFFGKKEEEIIGKTDFELMPEEGAHNCSKTDMQVIESSSLVISEEITGDRSYETVKFPVRLSQDKTGIGGFIRDITERKEAVQKVIESEQSLQAILTASPIGIGRVKNRVIEWVNESMCRISGYAFEELKGKSTRLFHESDEAFETVGESLYTTRQAEHRLVRKDGTIRDVFVQVSTIGSYSFTFNVTDMTRQKQTEKDLRKSELLYRTLMEKSSEILMLLDAKHRRTYVSPNITKILGYTVDEFLTGDRADFTHPDSVFAVESARSWSLQHPGKPVTFTARNRHKDGSWRWFEVTASNMLKEPNVNAMVLNLHDINERKEAEEALGASQRQLSEPMEFTQKVYWEFDPVAETFILNDPFYALYGTTAEREGGYRMKRDEYANRFVHMEDLPIFYGHMKSNKAITDSEHRIIRDDGEVRHILVQMRVVHDAHGSITRIFGANQDITDRKRMEEKLRETEERFGLFMEYNPVYVFFKDENMRTLQLSKNFEDMLERPLSDLIGKTAYDLFPHDLAELMIKNDLKVLNENKVVEFEEDRDGRHYTTVEFPIIREKKPPLLAGFTIDVTEQEHSKLAIAESMEKLRTLMGSVINVVIMAVEVRDPYTAGHQKRVSVLARAIATEMKLPPEQTDGIRMAGSIHDLGKISIPAEILSSPRKLSDIEFSLIKTHPQVGFSILKDIDFPWHIADIVLQHHERLDGSGYPDGLKNGDILLEARIITIADVVEAVASHRPYRPALGIDIALAEIDRNKGVLYDPEATDACLRLFREKGFKLQ